MVVIHLKNTDNEQFLYEATTDTPNEVLIRDLVSLVDSSGVFLTYCNVMTTYT